MFSISIDLKRLIFIILTILFGYFGVYYVVSSLFHLDKYSFEGFLFSRIIQWIILILIYIYITKYLNEPFFFWKNQSIKWYLYLLLPLLIFVSYAFISSLIHQLKLDQTDSKVMHRLVLLLSNNFYLVIFTCITAGVVEELIFRGILQPLFVKIFNNKLVGILLSSLLFGLMHAGYGTLMNVIGPFIFGIIAAILYQRHKNIGVLILAHFLIDFLSITLNLTNSK